MAEDRQPLRRRDLEAVEIDLLADGIYEAYGFDFRQYAQASLKRRLHRRMAAEGLETVSQLQDRLLHDRTLQANIVLWALTSLAIIRMAGIGALQ